MTPTLTVTPLATAGRAKLGESPVWDPRRARLYWVDIVAGRLHWLDEGAVERGSLALPGPVGFVSLTNDPQTVLVGCFTRLLTLHLPSERTEVLAELAPADSGLRCNDGKCDPTGRLWAGTCAVTGIQPPGALFAIEPARSPRRHLHDLACSNGLAWHAWKREFYFIDSLTWRIDCYHWDPATGDISDPRPVATFSRDDGLPDGMCIDADGHLWVAFWDRGCVRRIDGRTGAILARINLPVARATSCAFGGAELDTLFITTAAVGLDPAARVAQPLAGHIFSVRPGPHGLQPGYFGLHAHCSP